ncbi:MAG: DUF3830 family protein [Actinobacteria bacterium]|nr:DUF3830 family protein [Actinomycetota bacterium]
MRSIEIEFLRSGAVVTAGLLWAEAPETSAAIWEALRKPVRSRARHAIWSGKEVFFYLPPMPGDLPLENHTIFPEPGELMFFFAPENRLKGLRDIKYREPGDIRELAVFYGESNLRLTMERGWRGSVVGRVAQEDVAKLVEACEDIYWNGAFDVRVRRKASEHEGR